ncbi:PQQ-binding-like beta-propeller repeat protein [Natrinema longum]|uniref:PQQ-binding-like beta-propeller repeat protein n=1 Tax=Natrinema longum TaxID=370324 RepID=A0A8A2UA50_9EURY|nr:PQQ-binding-like beta-propeller repeat protein [Natrinema longum]MBZ6493591.1 PQQ-binding-like beta-propeller repeat protein [Natrinema longum]QSW85065.1 PQQ-binding-like beta-propeller repeat protein [Natrinema longum]
MVDTADTERDRPLEFRSVPLGEIETARSRHMWTRSAVEVAESGNLVVTGEWDGTVTARDADSLEARWTVEHPDHAVGIASLEGGSSDDGDETIVVAGRGESGTIAAYDAATGDRRWRYDTVEDLGEAVKDTVFYLPYVVALESGADGRLYAAARRYERDGEIRRWHSTVYAFAADGSVRWTAETDASPIALDLDADGERLAVGYNRCMGDHDTGLVVLEAASGDPLWSWDPGTEGDRRVGDVSFDGESIAVSSHGDKRGYLLGPGGAERWRVDLAVETELEDETLYAYPNHAYADDGRVAFVTGNTYAVESRETERRHPNEHRIAAFDADGALLWDDEVRGFVHGLAADGGRLVAPCAQNFRVRDPDTHAVRWFDLESGASATERLDGIATAAAVEGETVAAIEEPVAYHDEGETRGEYALRVGSLE